MSDTPLRQLSFQNGLVSFNAEPGVKYKWMLHESKAWFENAKRIQGKDWYWSKEDAPEVTYVFDELGFRNNLSIEEVSEDPSWWLFDSACFGLGPGVDVERTAPRMLERYTGYKMYDISLFGDRPEYTCNNILELAKRWKNPPKRVLLHMTENPTGTFKINDDDRILNIDYTGFSIKETEDFSFFRNFEEQKVSEGHHRLFLKTIIKLCEVLELPLTWFYTGLEGDMSPLNYLQDQDFIFYNCAGASVGHYNSSDSFDDRIRIVQDTVIEPMIYCRPAPGRTTDEVGRDLFHPSPESHKLFAQKICNHFLETKQNF